uniref:Beta-secretase 2 n=1 Tax=Astyanax mexicanus TaxID=7994 RepID=A0A8B9I1S9_ASTMX
MLLLVRGSLLLLLLCCRTAHCVYKIPLKIFSPGSFSSSSAGLQLQAPKPNQTAPRSALSLASDPSGAVNFLDMVNNLKGDSGRGYYMEMVIGTPGQTLNILVDTGSSNFAVAAAPHPYIATYFNRLEFSIVVLKVTKNVNVKMLKKKENMNSVLNLLYHYFFQPDPSVEPFFNSLVLQTGIPDVFSLQMCGAGLSISTASEPAGGSLIMGGAEPTLYQGSVWYTPILQEWYYQVEVLKLEVADQNLSLDCKEYNTDKAIVDSGTTLLRLPVKVFNAVVEAISQMSLVQDFSSGFFAGTKLACWVKGESPWRFFPKISIYLRGTNSSQSFRLTVFPQLYIQPVTDLDGTLNCFRFGISSSTNGLVIGATVMEGFYVVFDRAQKRVGFAVSSCAEMNGVPVAEIAGPFPADGACIGTFPLQEPLLWIIAYSLMGVCALVLLILLILLVVPCRRRYPDAEITDQSSLVRHRIK